MLNKLIVAGLLSGVLFAQELPKLEIQEATSLPTAEESKNSVETKLTKGLAYFDSCTQTDYISSNDYKKDDKCREYYSEATSTYLFNINQFDLSSFLLNEYGNKLKFTTKIIVPEELIRDDKIYLLSDEFNSSMTGLIDDIINFKSKYRYLINGEEISGNNILIDLKGKNTIDLTLELIFTIEYKKGIEQFNKMFNEDKNKALDTINKLINHNLMLQEKKRGEKKTVKLTSEYIGQVE